MNLNSKLDKESLRRKFFDAVGDAFARGASVQDLLGLSLKRGVWDEEVREQLAQRGIQEQIKGWIRNAKDSSGIRIYHSLPSYDSDGNEIQIYKPVALFSLEDYKIKLRDYEKRIHEHVAIYIEMVEQAKERYGYQHPLPLEVQSYVDASAQSSVETLQDEAA
jgi:hypothetical protein